MDAKTENLNDSNLIFPTDGCLICVRHSSTDDKCLKSTKISVVLPTGFEFLLDRSTVIDINTQARSITQNNNFTSTNSHSKTSSFVDSKSQLKEYFCNLINDMYDILISCQQESTSHTITPNLNSNTIIMHDAADYNYYYSSNPRKNLKKHYTKKKDEKDLRSKKLQLLIKKYNLSCEIDDLVIKHIGYRKPALLGTHKLNYFILPYLRAICDENEVQSQARDGRERGSLETIQFFETMLQHYNLGSRPRGTELTFDGWMQLLTDYRKDLSNIQKQKRKQKMDKIKVKLKLKHKRKGLTATRHLTQNANAIAATVGGGGGGNNGNSGGIGINFDMFSSDTDRDTDSGIGLGFGLGASMVSSSNINETVNTADYFMKIIDLTKNVVKTNGCPCERSHGNMCYLWKPKHDIHDIERVRYPIYQRLKIPQQNDGIFYYIPSCQGNNNNNNEFLLCWGEFESEKISNIIQDSVECLSGLKYLCDIIGNYCGGIGNGINYNVENLFQLYQMQVNNYENDIKLLKTYRQHTISDGEFVVCQ